MNKYLLSVDPSMKNTGFTLWEKNISKDWKKIQDNTPYEYWKPILIESYSFNKKSEVNSFITNNFNDLINDFIFSMLTVKKNTFLQQSDIDNILSKLTLIIERGIFNPKMGRGKETLDHLRGFIAGQFNKLLTKDMLISSSEWRKWYLNQENIIDTLIYNENENIGIANHPNNKWNKDLSIKIVNYLTIINNWNIKISNHDEAESLLIGWYYLNKENK
ncbi:hypothetical protein [Spiroplasma endosymbiont of Virgichneumon dumeticola]|uniref:hypothetical protein n=1 Tax=Spiroplasma endosymbiont of Virgichneumon dumeticola TaxID=3139323 RepID=UPI0035C88154